MNIVGAVDALLTRCITELEQPNFVTRRLAARKIHSLILRDDTLATEVVRRGAVPPLQRICVTSMRGTGGMRREAILTLALLTLTREGALACASSHFIASLLRLCLPPLKKRRLRHDAKFGYEACFCLSALAADAGICADIAAAGGAAVALTLAASQTSFRHSLAGLQLLSRLIDSPGTAAQLVSVSGAVPLASLTLEILSKAKTSEEYDLQRAALLAIGKLGEVESFAQAFSSQDGVRVVMAEAQSEVPALWVTAGFALACMGRHDRLRVELVKRRTLQLFVGMANVTSRRWDVRDCKKVAALGFKNLCNNYALRLAARAAGGLPAVTRLLADEEPMVRVCAAEACQQLAMDRENGRRMVMVGSALLSLRTMLLSSDQRQMKAAIAALAVLALSDENQKSMIFEAFLPLLKLACEDVDLEAGARALLGRLRLGRFRAAARAARELANAARRGGRASKLLRGNAGISSKELVNRIMNRQVSGVAQAPELGRGSLTLAGDSRVAVKNEVLGVEEGLIAG